MDININAYNMCGYQSAIMQAGDTLLVMAADNQGIRIDADTSLLGAGGLPAALTALLQLSDRRPLYAYLDRRDADHQRLAQAMQQLGGTATAVDGRFIMWAIQI